MGIPSYFSHIIKNHGNMIKKQKFIKNIDNLYLDSNSIIYDCLGEILKKEKELNDKDLEKLLCKSICLKIEKY